MFAVTFAQERRVTRASKGGARPACAAALLAAVLSIGTCAFARPAMAEDVSGAGATFPYPVYAKWAEAYKRDTGVGLNYQPIGSGGGIKQIQAATVTFGASDQPLDPAKLEASGLVQWPMIIGGVVPVANVKGLEPGQLVLDGSTLAAIYLGEIKKWNDERIGKLNPGLALPNQYIAPVYRSDGSGTTFLFTTYLSDASPSFKSKVGANTSVAWPIGFGAKGNEGVANMALRTAGVLTYVEYAYAKQLEMNYVRLLNRDGQAIAPTIASFQSAARSADWSNAPGYNLVLVNQPGAQSWPITGASFILMPGDVQRPSAARTALEFFAWAFSHGDESAEALGYVPLPDSLVGMVERTWSKEIRTGGKPLWVQ
jgi:phosphate transport system substrate-binding protein